MPPKKAKAPAKAGQKTARTASKAKAGGRKKRAKSASGSRPGPKRLGSATTELTPEAQAFEDALRECSRQERVYVQESLLGASQPDAVLAAGYKCKSRDSAAAVGRQIAQRLRVKNAMEAGYSLYCFTTQDLLDDINGLRLFDRSQVEREIKVTETTTEERPAKEVLQELLARERVVEDKLDSLFPEHPAYPTLAQKLSRLMAERIDLEAELVINPDATTFVPVQQLVTKRVFDYDLAREKGLLKYIKEIKPTKHGDEIKLHDWLEGLDRAAKARGLYKDSHEVTGRDGEPLQNTPAVIVLPSNGRDSDV